MSRRGNIVSITTPAAQTSGEKGLLLSREELEALFTALCVTHVQTFIAAH